MNAAYRTAVAPRTLDEMLLAIRTSDGARDAIATVARRLGGDPAEHPTCLRITRNVTVLQEWLGASPVRPLPWELKRGMVLGVGTFITVEADRITMQCSMGTDVFFCLRSADYDASYVALQE
jgi:hypothetical protein